MRGWRVFTRPPSISGEPVTSATPRWSMPASARAAEVLPLATSSQPEVGQAAGQLDQPRFVVDREQRPHARPSAATRPMPSSEPVRRQLVERPQHGGRIEPRARPP